MAKCCNPQSVRLQPPEHKPEAGTMQTSQVQLVKQESDKSKQKKLSKNDFRLQGELGRGGFGKVWLVKKHDTGKQYALKEIKKSFLVGIQAGQKITTEDIFNEKNIMKDSNSPFVVKLYSSFQDKFNIYFLMELVVGGNLFGYLKERRMFPEEVARFYSAEVVLALEYLHDEMNIIYRDLKPENILVGEDGHIKLSDFGLSKIADRYKGSIKGTPDFIAPEVFQGMEFTKMVDYWSLGCLIYEMIYGHPAFTDNSSENRVNKILTGKFSFPPNDKVSEDAKDLIRKLLIVDQTKRLGYRGIQEIKGHPFYKSIDWNDLKNKKNTAPITKITQKIKNAAPSYETPRENNHEAVPIDIPGFTYDQLNEKSLC